MIGNCLNPGIQNAINFPIQNIPGKTVFRKPYTENTTKLG